MAQETPYEDELTENGISTDNPDVTLIEYMDLHGEPVFENEDVIIFADSYGYELSEWAKLIGTDRSELSSRMHDIARKYHTYGDVGSGAGDPWAVVDPIVFNARTMRSKTNSD